MRVVRDHRGGERKKPPYPFNIPPTKSEDYEVLKTEDYGLK
jgi:hypothetical protein